MLKGYDRVSGMYDEKLGCERTKCGLFINLEIFYLRH